jgi:gallate decarboxylase subunit D
MWLLYRGMLMMHQKFSKTSLTFSVGSGKFRIDVSLFMINGGIVAVVGGGERSHIGAVATAVPYTKAKNRLPNSSSSVITLPGHKDDVLAKSISEKLAKSLNQVVVVVAGVHVDNASKSDIELLVSNCMECTEKAISHLKNSEAEI